jgi:hypothetical protein
MVQFSHDGLEMWYGTPDAPAPDGTTEPRHGVSVTVGVRPPNPSNAASVRYRVDGRGIETVSAHLVAHDFESGKQYFRATFSDFWSGETVEYLPVVSCDGRRAPDPATASTFPSTFRLRATDVVQPMDTRTAPPRHRPAMFVPRLDHVAHVDVSLAERPELVGETPAGYIVNWPPVRGTLDGPALRGTLIPGGEHQVIIRPDGIGALSVSVTVETHDGALILVRYSGTADYGEDWSRRAERESWPAVLPIRSQVRLLTCDARYRWLNRLDCLGVGEVRAGTFSYVYDMYAVR